MIRAGETFRFIKDGPVDQLENKQAYVVITQGDESLGTPTDLQTPYLTMALELIGIDDVEFIYAKGLARGEETADAGMRHVLQIIEALT